MNVDNIFRCKRNPEPGIYEDDRFSATPRKLTDAEVVKLTDRHLQSGRYSVYADSGFTRLAPWPKTVSTVSLLCGDDPTEILEAYSDAESQLRMDIRCFYYAAENCESFLASVFDAATGDLLVTIDYSIKPNDTRLHLFRIHSVRHDQPMWTTKAHLPNAATDLGHGAMRWILKKIGEDARQRGYDVKEWQATTRMSGAFAKANFDPTKPFRMRNAGGKIPEQVCFTVRPIGQVFEAEIL